MTDTNYLRAGRVAQKPPRYQHSQVSLPSNLSMVIDKNGNSLDIVLSVPEFSKAFFSPKAGCTNAADLVPIKQCTRQDVVPSEIGIHTSKHVISALSILSSPNFGGQELTNLEGKPLCLPSSCPNLL